MVLFFGSSHSYYSRSQDLGPVRTTAILDTSKEYFRTWNSTANFVCSKKGINSTISSDAICYACLYTLHSLRVMNIIKWLGGMIINIHQGQGKVGQMKSVNQNKSATCVLFTTTKESIKPGCFH